MQAPPILYQDNHLLVVDKPAGLATMGAESGPTLHRWAADYLKREFNKPGKAFVGIVSRLDTVTSGVIVLARTSKAASRLVPQFGETSSKKRRTWGRAGKTYLAIVERRMTSPSGELTGWLRKDDEARRMRIVPAHCDGARDAKLRYVVVDQSRTASLVVIQLLTGRKHQIRCQFSATGHPVLGDRKYDAHGSFPVGVALHSWRLQITHPTLHERMTFEAAPPNSWGSFHAVVAEQRSALDAILSHWNNEPAGEREH